MIRRLFAWLSACLTTALLMFAPVGASAEEGRSGGKLFLTNGISTVEGSAGGGLASWALIGGNETDRGVGGTAHATLVELPDFRLMSAGAAVGIRDRIELSYAHQRFDTRDAGAVLGLGRGFAFSQDVIGAKLRVAGDAVWDQDRWLPQIAIGVQHKIADRKAVIHAIGGRHRSGTDLYVSATKLFLARSLIVDGTVRFTKANQFGLLGFGGDRHVGRTAQFEGSAGLLLSRAIVVGGEYRSKPDNLGFARERRSIDAFAAWAVQRHATLTAAWVDLGPIATFKRQRGLFLSLQAAF